MSWVRVVRCSLLASLAGWMSPAPARGADPPSLSPSRSPSPSPSLPSSSKPPESWALVHDQAVDLFLRTDYRPAVDRFSRAIQLAEAGGTRQQIVMSLWGMTQAREGQLEKDRALSESLANDYESLIRHLLRDPQTARHEALADYYSRLARVLMLTKQYDQVLKLYRTLLPHWRWVFGTPSARVAEALDGIAFALAKGNHQRDEALLTYKEALETWYPVNGYASAHAVDVLVEYSHAHRIQGRTDEARNWLEEAHRVMSLLPGADPRALFLMQVHILDMEARGREYGPLFDHLDTTTETALGPSLEAATIYWWAGCRLLGQKDLVNQAATLLEKALRIHRTFRDRAGAGSGSQSRVTDMRYLLCHLARVYEEMGALGWARDALEEFLALRTETSSRNPPSDFDAARYLAFFHRQAGDLQRALEVEQLGEQIRLSIEPKDRPSWSRPLPHPVAIPNHCARIEWSPDRTGSSLLTWPLGQVRRSSGEIAR